MKLSLCTLGCPNWKLDQVLERAAAMGYDGVELRGSPGEHIGAQESVESRAAIKQAFTHAGLKPACIMGYSRFTWDDPAKRAEEVQAAIQFLEVARDIGCPNLRVFGGVWKGIDKNEAVKRVVDSIQQIVPHAERTGVTIAFETHDDWCRGKNIRAVLDAIPSRKLGVCWDISNAWWAEPLEETYALIRDRVVHVHFKDSKKTPDGKIEPVLVGRGEVDLLRGLKTLHDGGYKGWVSFEWEKKWHPNLEEPEVAFPHFIEVMKDIMSKAGVPRG